MPFGPQLAKRVFCIEHTRWLVLRVDNPYVDEAALTNFWFIPETFSVENRIEIQSRRTAKFLRTVNSNKGAHQLKLLISEIKAIETARYAHEITIKRLRYNIATDRPLAKVVLSDTAPPPGALLGSFDRCKSIP